MLKLGRKVEYALIAILHISELDEDEIASKREISEQYSIPNELLGKVLQALKRAGIVDSTQGIRGGYSLAKSLEELTLGSVIEAIDGPMHSPECSCIRSNCEREDVCNIRSMMNRFYGELQDVVFSTSLEAFRTGFTPKTTSLTANLKV